LVKPNFNRTHCKNGHVFTENTKYFHRKDSDGNILYNYFSCKICRKERDFSIQSALVDELYQAYGNKCSCCGETNKYFFTIDHIFNDGNIERRESGKGKHIYRKLRELNYPQDRYRILCFNCNMGRERNGGICPHVSGGKQS